MNTCKTCRWWDNSKWVDDEFGRCTHPHIRRGDDPLVVTDIKGEHVGFHKDFGCIFHEEKEEK